MPHRPSRKKYVETELELSRVMSDSFVTLFWNGSESNSIWTIGKENKTIVCHIQNQVQCEISTNTRIIKLVGEEEGQHQLTRNQQVTWVSNHPI